MKVLMVDQFLPNSVYVVELCRELRKYAKITIFCKKNAGTDLDGVIWKAFSTMKIRSHSRRWI